MVKIAAHYKVFLLFRLKHKHVSVWILAPCPLQISNIVWPACVDLFKALLSKHSHPKFLTNCLPLHSRSCSIKTLILEQASQKVCSEPLAARSQTAVKSAFLLTDCLQRNFYYRVLYGSVVSTIIKPGLVRVAQWSLPQ